MVKVLAKDGSPLADTNRHGRVRHLLNRGRAVIVTKDPFTIRLTYDTITNETEALKDAH